MVVPAFRVDLRILGNVADQLETTSANNYGDRDPERVTAHVDCVERFGPHTPEASRPVHADLTSRHVYASAGTYTVTFPFKSLGDCT